MTDGREEILNKLIGSYEAYYNVTKFGKEESLFRALCEYFERSEKYVLSKRAELWSTRTEEFLFLYSGERLTSEVLEKCMETAWNTAMRKADIGPGHMVTWVTVVFVCDSADTDAVSRIKKYRKQKNFLFSFHGWMESRAVWVKPPSIEDAAAEKSGENTVHYTGNRGSREVVKQLQGVLGKRLG